MPRELRDKFKKVTQKTGTSMNSTICQLVAEHIYKMEQLGLADIEEPHIIQVEPVKKEVKPKPKIRKPAKKKQDGEKNAGSKETEG